MMGNFCGKCGTSTRMVRTPMGVRRFCPRCYPEKNGEPQNKKYCDMKQICKPEKCPFGADCPEGCKKHRSG